MLDKRVAEPLAIFLNIWSRDLAWCDPHAAAGRFADVPGLALLDSTGPADATARYSFLCVDPFEVICAGDDAALLRVAAVLAAFRFAPDPAEMPFRGGLVGFIGYEPGARLAGVATAAPGPDDPPDLVLGAYDLAIGFDRVERRCRVYASGLPAREPSERRARALARLDWAAERIRRPMRHPARLAPLAWRADWTPAAYRARLRRLLDYIEAGDIFQANLTMRQVAVRPAGVDGWDVQGALRQANPAPFGAWLRFGPFDLCCSSPERFMRLDPDGTIETKPIKGTAARAGDEESDRAALARLLASGKDRAENVMIVDVLRNDVGRVAAIGSVAVPALCAPHSFATVHHLVSTVTGRLRPGLGAIDLLRAALPGGSVTGAPKIRAMQIIAELEQARRGPYCGCVVMLGFDGAMDSNIVIRSLLLTPRRIIAQSGGGIVAQSDPDAEYAEMLLKSAPMRGVFGTGG